MLPLSKSSNSLVLAKDSEQANPHSLLSNVLSMVSNNSSTSSGSSSCTSTSGVGFSMFKGSPEAAPTVTLSTATPTIANHNGSNSSCFKLKSSPMSGTNSAFKLRTEASSTSHNNNNSNSQQNSNGFHFVKSPSANSSNVKVIGLMTPKNSHH